MLSGEKSSGQVICCCSAVSRPKLPAPEPRVGLHEQAVDCSKGMRAKTSGGKTPGCVGCKSTFDSYMDVCMYISISLDLAMSLTALKRQQDTNLGILLCLSVLSQPVSMCLLV